MEAVEVPPVVVDSTSKPSFSYYAVSDLISNRRTLLVIVILVLCFVGLYLLFRRYTVAKQELEQLRNDHKATEGQLNEAKRMIMSFMSEAQDIEMEDEMFEAQDEEEGEPNEQQDKKESVKKPPAPAREISPATGMMFVVASGEGIGGIGESMGQATIEELHDDDHTQTVQPPNQVLEKILGASGEESNGRPEPRKKVHLKRRPKKEEPPESP